MSVSFQKVNIKGKVPATGVTGLKIKEIIETEGFFCGEICIIYCTDEYLLRINQEYLRRDYYTDVISFNYNKENIVSGDIFISIERVRENASAYKVSFENELNRIIIHGVLHLCGYLDSSAELKSVMSKREGHYLSTLVS